MQRVGERDGVTFYDDSKATNVAAVLASLDGFPRPFVLVAGGRAKGEDLSGLRPLLRAHARGLVALGEAADAFVALAHDLVPTQRATDMHDAVHRAISLARPGDAIVLSPACASFDMYESFAHRGRDFARVVAELGRG
jgi:UDP-N-acetylmuramoylalanine--D-glutamate ligase